jgi:hypothetical protein
MKLDNATIYYILLGFESTLREYINMLVLWCPKKMQKQSFTGMSLQQFL